MFLFWLAYILEWHVLFPKTSDQVLYEKKSFTSTYPIRMTIEYF